MITEPGIQVAAKVYFDFRKFLRLEAFDSSCTKFISIRNKVRRAVLDLFDTKFNFLINAIG